MPISGFYGIASAMDLDVLNLPDDPVQLKKIIVSLFDDSQRKIDHLEEMIRLLKNEIFGRRSDKRPVADSRQFSLFELSEQELPDETDEPQERQPVNGGHTRRRPVRKLRVVPIIDGYSDKQNDGKKFWTVDDNGAPEGAPLV